MAIVGVKPENCNQTDLENIKSRYKKKQRRTIVIRCFSMFCISSRATGRIRTDDPRNHNPVL